MTYGNQFITGLTTHSVGGQTSNCRWCLSSSVTLHGGPAGGFTRAGQAIIIVINGKNWPVYNQV